MTPRKRISGDAMSLDKKEDASMLSSPVEVVDKIRELLETADNLWRQLLTPATQNELNAVHHEECSIGHCLRWGLQAAEELIARDTLTERGQMKAELAERMGQL